MVGHLETFSEIAEDQRTIFLDFEMAGHIVPEKQVVTDHTGLHLFPHTRRQ